MMLGLRWIAMQVILMLLVVNTAWADLHSGVTATATSELVSGALDRAAVHTVDSSGLSGALHAASGEGRFWESVGIGAGFGVDRAPAITFDLQEACFVDTMRLWNFAEAASAVRRADVLVSLDVLENGSGTVFPFLTGNPPTSGFAGLGEVQFFATVVPEPSSLLLITIGGAVLFMGSRWFCGQRANWRETL
jgi:hypothetical protein